jgi:hypothetical protein
MEAGQITKCSFRYDAAKRSPAAGDGSGSPSMAGLQNGGHEAAGPHLSQADDLRSMGISRSVAPTWVVGLRCLQPLR